LVLRGLVWVYEIVMPAKAGIQRCRTWRRNSCNDLDSGLRRNDRQEKIVCRRKPASNDGARMKQPCVYLLASGRNGTLYVGVTSNLVSRVWVHKQEQIDGFTKRYGVHTLVWYEVHESMDSAIQREKAIKEWKRRWKLDLIEKANPQWRDLYEELL
jgi:putative endonuclease